MMEALCASEVVKRDWLWGVRCRLCTRERPDRGERQVKRRWATTVPQSEVERVRIAADVCWWCFYRIAFWKERRRQPMMNKLGHWFSPEVGPVNILDVIEFTAHVIKTKPKWLGNPEAYHPLMTTKEKTAIGYTYNHHNQYTVRRA